MKVAGAICEVNFLPNCKKFLYYIWWEICLQMCSKGVSRPLCCVGLNIFLYFITINLFEINICMKLSYNLLGYLTTHCYHLILILC